jgi:hypothetical protein
VYNLILITTQVFLGQYATLDNCNNAIRGIYERQYMPYPQLVSEQEKVEVRKVIDLEIKWQTKYLCVKVK